MVHEFPYHPIPDTSLRIPDAIDLLGILVDDVVEAYHLGDVPQHVDAEALIAIVASEVLSLP